eukprot:TRINITY_DN10107_c0_g1_i2.p1 TRINITY_DN10107_c0_g1~~TRINITY_DN10107_c0_g1_i2.p1  ORF type:complete len:161 (-),score=51.46 TRINITY_DN10107_c0_g1_i2:106-528(-)
MCIRDRRRVHGVNSRAIILYGPHMTMRDVFVFLGEVAVIAFPLIYGGTWIINTAKGSLQSPWLALFILLVAVGYTADNFVIIWSAGSEALLHLFAVDEEKHAPAMFAPEILKDVNEEILNIQEEERRIKAQEAAATAPRK